MNKKIFILLFFLFVLISMSAVSAVDADDNNDTIVSSADAEALAIENDVNAMEELNEDDTGSDDVLQSDVKSAAAGEKEILSVEDSDSDVLGVKESKITIDDAYYQKIGSDYKIIVTGYVSDVYGEDINKGTVSIYLNDESKGTCTADNGMFSGEVDVGPGSYNVRVRYHDDSGDYIDSQNDYEDNPIIINPPEPVTWYVNGSKPYGNGGKSEEDAFSTLNEALYAASNNDTVKIAAGTYTGSANIGPYIQKILTFEKYGDGEAIFDGQGQTIWSVGVDTINIYGLTFKNGGDYYGAAIYFLRDVSNSVINATFINNSVSIYGGAIYVGNSVSNLTLQSTFINNHAGEYGGAIYVKSTASNLILNSTFIGNTADNKGAGVYIGGNADNVKVYGEYRNNVASQGGVIYANKAFSSSVIDATFINNTAKNLGGAFCFNGDLTGVDISGKFLNNTGGDSIIYVVNSVSGNSIHDSVFLNNEAYKIITVYNGEITAKDNWFGSDASNYYKIPDDVGIDLENWLFLNATANPSKINPNEKSTIIFKLSSFGGSEISDYDASKMNIALDLSQTLGALDKTSASIGENITYTAKESGNATVTGKFETASYTVSLTNYDPRTPTSINVTNSTLDLKAKDDVDVGATLTPADAGNLTYTSSNPSVVIVENGTIKAIGAGNATITVSFAGNEWYSPAGNKTIDVTVRALDANWTYINIYTGNESDLDCALLYLPWNYVPTCYVRDANGTGLPAGTNITIFCEGNQNYTLNAVVQDNGLFSVNVSDVVPGKYSVIFAAGKAYKTATATIVVMKVDTNITVDNETVSLIAGDEVGSGATLTPADAGNLTYTSSNPSVVKVENGKIIALAEGNATITVSFAGNEWYYAAGNKTIDVTVRVLDANWTYINIFSGKEIELNGTFEYISWNYAPTCYVKDANGTGLPAGTNVTIFCEGDKNYTLNAVVQDNGLFSVNVSDVALGNYKVTFSAGKAYKTATATIVVVKALTNITVANETISIIIDDEVGSGASLTPADAGNLTYTSSNPSVVKVENGTIKAISAGNATITVSFAGNDKYFAAENKTINVTVGLKNVIINVQNSTVKLIFGDSFTINATTVPEGLNLTYVVDNSGVISVDENGTVTTLKLGSASILVKFDGDDVYAANSTVVYIDVFVNRVEIPPEKAFNFTTTENGTQVVSVNLPKDATGFVMLDINGTQTHVELVNGTANITIPKLAEGTYNATVTYTGDDWYAPITTTKEINVTSNVPESALSIPDTSKSDYPTTYSISLPSDATGFLEVEVDGKLYSAPLSNGSASVTIPALSDGSHNVTVRYTGDEKYSPVTQQATLNVSAPAFKLSNNKDVSALYSAKATYKVLVTRDGKAVGADEKVTFTYNGKTYTVRTDKNGYATLNLKTNVKVKKYTVTAEYKGVKVTNKVTVKNIINAKNKKVKKSKKVTKVKVSLKKVNGKYLKDKVIKIKFNGKYYKVVTNKKGVATWKVKKSMVKKLKKGKKYKYKLAYGSDTVTKKLTIKK